MRKKYKSKTESNIRLSEHEKICAERMSTLIKSIDELRVDVKDLRGDMNKGKGVIAFLVIIGSFVAAIAGVLKLIK